MTHTDDSHNRSRRRGRTGDSIATAILIGIAVILIFLIFFLMRRWGILKTRSGAESETQSMSNTATVSTYIDERGEEFWRGAPEIDAQLLTPNTYSRPQIALERITGVVVHYVANPGSTAQQNRDYYEGLADGLEGTHVSSHFVIGLEGEIIQCVPSSEIAYASNSANDYTLSIECCHPDESGEFTEETYQSLVELVGWLCHAFQIEEEGILRHYDITEKICPKYFVDHEDAWEQFKADAIAYQDSISL